MPMASDMLSRMARPAKRYGHTHYIESHQQLVCFVSTTNASKLHFKMRMHRNNK